jgi:hypothetical protein
MPHLAIFGLGVVFGVWACRKSKALGKFCQMLDATKEKVQETGRCVRDLVSGFVTSSDDDVPVQPIASPNGRLQPQQKEDNGAPD